MKSANQVLRPDVWWRLPLVAAFAMTMLNPAAVPLVTAEEFSAANTLLFDTDHFASISEPVTLHYLFARRGSQAQPFEDRIDVRILGPGQDDGKRVNIDYFSGARQREIPPIASAQGNPVIMVFLQRDVNELGRLTGGGWRYFQKRLRVALTKAEELEAVSITWNGREVAAQRITLTPYLDDPNRERFMDYAGRTYDFILSPEVPGHVYQLQISTPDRTDADADPLIEDRISLTSVSPD